MSDFVNYLFHYLGRAAYVMVFILALAAVVLVFAVKRHKQRHGDAPFPWGRAILMLMLAGYVTVVLFVTTGRGNSYYLGGANFHLFRAWREAWNSFSERNWLNVLLNIGMFVPLGILLPLVWKQLRKWYRMLPAGFGVSLYIEIVQYLEGSGLFDVDDLFCNTLGAMIGFWLVMVVLSACGREMKRSICHGLMLLAAAAAIGSIFVVYELQEYGNLSAAPAFRVDTSDVEWTVGCELGDEEQTVSIYRTQPWSKGECEAFGREFFENLGITEVDVTIYNEEVYLREYMGNRILEVFYQDGHYEFNDLAGALIDEVVYVQKDEKTLRAELLKYGIEVPEAAEFSYEGDGVHYFRLDRYADGETMTDGALTCIYTEEIGIREIYNDLITFEYYGEGEIISPEAAVEQVKSGWISGGDAFRRYDPKQVEILSCELVYQVDTKGFYQPVYEIALASEDGAYQNTVMIPALK